MANTNKRGSIYDSCTWGFTAYMYETGELEEFLREDYGPDWDWICAQFDWPGE
jgi:hypothetical protein